MSNPISSVLGNSGHSVLHLAQPSGYLVSLIAQGNLYHVQANFEGICYRSWTRAFGTTSNSIALTLSPGYLVSLLTQSLGHLVSRLTQSPGYLVSRITQSSYQMFAGSSPAATFNWSSREAGIQKQISEVWKRGDWSIFELAGPWGWGGGVEGRGWGVGV